MVPSRGLGFRLSEKDPEAKKANFDEGVNEDFENGNWDGENGFCEAECQGFEPEGDKCLLNASERDGAEHGPLDGAEIPLKEFANKIEDEDGECDAGVGHGDVEGEPDLGVPGE
jgi:hypothetical protein